MWFSLISFLKIKKQFRGLFIKFWTWWMLLQFSQNWVNPPFRYKWDLSSEILPLSDASMDSQASRVVSAVVFFLFLLKCLCFFLCVCDDLNPRLSLFIFQEEGVEVIRRLQESLDAQPDDASLHFEMVCIYSIISLFNNLPHAVNSKKCSFKMKYDHPGRIFVGKRRGSEGNQGKSCWTFCDVGQIEP